uniref:30S ribosomal protein S17 n=1 Tax=Nephromyces sp. ex Molgula occidentalis TaxID=2544991 RepID=A0A5C1H7F8_9APIC|nr:30S ribosomal protein S17 [Nephromyces sp. ex Molgula occidentalis]
MNKIYKGFVVSKKQPNLIWILYSFLKYNKKYNIKKIKYIKYLIEDFRNEAKIGDWVLFKIISPKSKNKYFKLIKIIKKNDTNRKYF